MINIDRAVGASVGRASRLPALLGACLAGVLGCSGDPDAARAVGASGTVKVKGQPLESGTIQFVPEKGRAATGKITGGRFVLTTNEPDDGAIAGKHAVAIISQKEMPAKPGAEPEMVSVIDKKYGSTETSGLTVEIPAGGKTDIAIDLP